jgi:hypothetical protein
MKFSFIIDNHFFYLLKMVSVKNSKKNAKIVCPRTAATISWLLEYTSVKGLQPFGLAAIWSCCPGFANWS